MADLFLPKERDFLDQSGAFIKLAHFPPVVVLFEFVDDPEPKHMAEQINFVLSELHWNTSRRRGHESSILPGVWISVGSNIPTPSLVDSQHDEILAANAEVQATLRKIAEGLRDGIKQSKIDVELGSDAADLPPSTLLIRVGQKPNHTLEDLARELGPYEITPMGRVRAGGNWMDIPEQTGPENKTPQ